ncbi:hypothetical protein [Actinomadura roseirufa]|uniref:hypothetical protein n=1 Tax=Actinomadura roseirufa TaxID=2094049 RepID=UPI001A955AD7|nr:hypothetical protein [Actinomadura roseirufa]
MVASITPFGSRPARRPLRLLRPAPARPGGAARGRPALFERPRRSSRVTGVDRPGTTVLSLDERTAASERSRRPWLGWCFIAAGAAMVPWMWTLASRLPSTTQVSHWSAAWVGLDMMLAAGLLGTGVLFTRGDPRHGLIAAATGGMLLVDAWFDVVTAPSGAERTMAIALALGAELPLAALCAVLAARAVPRGTARDTAHGTAAPAEVHARAAR